MYFLHPQIPGYGKLSVNEKPAGSSSRGFYLM